MYFPSAQIYFSSAPIFFRFTNIFSPSYQNFFRQRHVYSTAGAACAPYLFLFGSRAIDIVIPNDNRMDEVLKTYFTKGYSYDKILQLLAKYHETHISLQTLQQKLYNLGLKRRNINYDREEDKL